MGRRFLVPVAAAVVAFGACSGGPSATDVLARAAESLGTIRSGHLHLSVAVETAPGAGSARVGFDLEGPFSLGEEGELPEARIVYRQFADDDEVTVTLTSTGETAYQTVGQQTTEMSEPQLDALRAAGGASGTSGFAQFDVGAWIDDAEVEEVGRVGGAESYLVTGRLDAVAALNGMVDAAEAFGAAGAGGLERLDEADARLIQDAIRSSSIEVYAGRDDGLLRALTLEVEFQADAEQEILDALGPLSGARLTFDLRIDDPNTPVEVDAPPGVVPSAPAS